MDKLQNSNKHKHIVDEIRTKITEMKESEWKITEMKENEWKITIYWVKAHAGVLGNKLADALV